MAGKEEAFSTRNYSMEANYQALEDLISSNPELWSDKYLLGTGAQLLRVIAAGQSANGVRTLQALYETLIGFMQRKDSILGYGETMGYSAFRGSNDVLTIKAVANSDLIIPARTVVGNVLDKDLVNTNAIVVNEGQSFTFTAKVGNLKTESRSIADTSFRYLRFLSENVSDDVLLYINDEPTKYVTAFKDAFNDVDNNQLAYVLITNAYGSVDIFVLNRDANTTMNPTDIYTINYIEYTDINYTENDVIFNHGDIISVTEATANEKPQEIESLRVSIPYFRDTQRAVLANRDPIKVLRLLLPNVEATSGTNLNSVHSLLTYKYSDFHLVPDAQLKAYESELAPIYYFGFCPSNIVHPIRYDTTLSVEVVLFSPQTETIDITEELSRVLSQYESLPEVSSMNFTTPINLDDIESELNKFQIDGEDIIKTAYVNLISNPVTSNTIVKVGEFYTEDNNTYRATGFTYLSGGTLPESYIGQYTPCGNILLEKWRLIWGAKDLEPDTYYAPDTIVKISDTENFRVHPLYYLPDSPFTFSNWCSITYGNQGFVALSTDGFTTVSENGIDWSSPQKLDTTTTTWNCISYGANLYLVVGNNGFISKSIDGVNWSSPVQKSTTNWNSVAYGDGIYAVVGENGYVTYSQTGSSWANPHQITIETLNSVTYSNNKFVAVGTNGAITYSEDGLTWVSPVQVGTNTWNSVIYGEGVYIAAGNDGYITRSTNGTDWETPIQVGTNSWNTITYSNGRFIVLGADGAFAYSTAGLVWSVPEQSNTINWRGLADNEETTVAVGNNGFTMNSQNSTTWSEPFTISVGGWSTTLGDFTYSDDMIWLTIEYTTGTTYIPGDYAIKGMIVTPENSNVSYQLVGFYKTVDSILTPGVSVEEVPEGLQTREIYNLWNSYTMLKVGNLNIHV